MTACWLYIRMNGPGGVVARLLGGTMVELHVGRVGGRCRVVNLVYVVIVACTSGRMSLQAVRRKWLPWLS